MRKLFHADLIRFIETRIPLRLSESWDNCGLQAGSRKYPLEGILCCLDISDEVIDEALKTGANFIFSHHPLLFKSLPQIDLDRFPGTLLNRAIKSGITLYSAHTNLDSVAGGVNDHLAQLLGVRQCLPLIPFSEKSFKLVTFVPEPEVETLAAALYATGAGKLGSGRYRECSFRSSGIGSFRPEDGASPYIGESGKISLVDEIRFETVVAEESVSQVLAALHSVHPYEVPAYDLYPIQFSDPGCGAGRVGLLEKEINPNEFSIVVKKRLQADSVRLIGAGLKKRVKKVALCGGSGFSLYKAAQSAGADIFVTGDLKHHDARSILEQGRIPVLDAGHYATEKPVADVCAAWCREFIDEKGADIGVAVAQSECEPWLTI